MIRYKDLAGYSIIAYVLLTMISSSSGDIYTKIARLFLVAVLGFQMFRNLVLSKKIRFYVIWELSFLMYAFIGCFSAYSKNYAIDFTVSLMYVVICNLFLIIYLSKHTVYIETVLKTIICGATLKAIMCYVSNGLFVFLNSRATEDISANTIGYYCAFACVLCIYFRKRENRAIYSIALVMNLCFLVLSASRKAFIFLLVPVAVQMILKSKNPLIVLRNIIIVIISAIIILFLLLRIDFLYSLIGNRIEGMINGLLGIGVVDGSTNTRMGLIADGMVWFRERPIWGYGLSNFKALCAYYRPWGSIYYAHNNYVELLVDCGIVGTLLYYLLHIKMILKGIKIRKKMSNIQLLLFGMLICIIICDYGMVTYLDIFTQLVLMLVYISFYCMNEAESNRRVVVEER